jgi:hypothetical protein
MRRRLKEPAGYDGGFIASEQMFGESGRIINTAKPRKDDGAVRRNPVKFRTPRREELAHQWTVAAQQRLRAGL